MMFTKHTHRGELKLGIIVTDRIKSRNRISRLELVGERRWEVRRIDEKKVEAV